MPTVFVSTKSVRKVLIKLMHHFGCVLLSFPGLFYSIIQINNVMAGFVAMCILTDHTGTEYRQFIIC